MFVSKSAYLTRPGAENLKMQKADKLQEKLRNSFCLKEYMIRRRRFYSFTGICFYNQEIRQDSLSQSRPWRPTVSELDLLDVV